MFFYIFYMLGLFIAADALDFLEKNKIPYLVDQLT